MKHLKSFKEVQKTEYHTEGFKSWVAGLSLLFMSACTNINIKDSSGNLVVPPKDTTINGVVTGQTFLPSKSDYYQSITVKDESNNIYNYKIYSNMITNSSWQIDEGDSVTMAFDDIGNSKVYKKK